MWRKHLFGSCLFLVTLFGCITLLPYRPLTSDEELTKYFFQHRADFEHIVRMMDEDSNVRSVYEEFVALTDSPVWTKDDQTGFSTERWNEYKRVFRQLGPLIHRVSKENGTIEIASATIAVSDIDEYESVVTSKNYVYIKTSDNPVLPSTYKKIDTDWYIHLDSGISKPE